jgi:hypothetical protein
VPEPRSRLSGCRPRVDREVDPAHLSALSARKGSPKSRGGRKDSPRPGDAASVRCPQALSPCPRKFMRGRTTRFTSLLRSALPLPLRFPVRNLWTKVARQLLPSLLIGLGGAGEGQTRTARVHASQVTKLLATE